MQQVSILSILKQTFYIQLEVAEIDSFLQNLMKQKDDKENKVKKELSKTSHQDL